jgi:hypothetical protein
MAFRTAAIRPALLFLMVASIYTEKNDTVSFR